MGALRALISWKLNGREQKLHDWWLVDRLTAEMIAKKLGVSLGAVLGKVHRMGWSNRSPKRRLAKSTSNVSFENRARYNRCKSARASFKGVVQGDGKVALVVTDSDPAPSERIEFIQLGSRTCRWPFDDANATTYCGRKRADRSSYCQEHLTRGTVQ